MNDELIVKEFVELLAQNSGLLTERFTKEIDILGNLSNHAWDLFLASFEFNEYLKSWLNKTSELNALDVLRIIKTHKVPKLVDLPLEKLCEFLP